MAGEPPGAASLNGVADQIRGEVFNRCQVDEQSLVKFGKGFPEFQIN